MARGPRLIFDQAVFHIINRGISQNILFRRKEDFVIFLKLIARYKKEIGFSLFHYTLMSNHIHLLLKIYKAKDLSRLMKSLTLSYTSRYHFKYESSGYLWQGRYQSMLVGDDTYLLRCGRYIERNPVEAGLVENPEDYPWTSYRVYAFGEENPLIDLNPAYLAISDNPDVRKKTYIKHVLSSTDKNNEYAFKDLGAYGRPAFKNATKSKLRKRNTC